MPRELFSPHTSRYEAPPPTVGGVGYDLSSDEHTPRTTFTGPYSAMNHANFGPPARYTSEMGYPLQVAGLAERDMHHGIQSDRVNHLLPIAQHVPLASRPPQLEYYAPLTPSQEMPNDGTISRAPSPNVAGPSQGVPSRKSAVEDLRQLASRYLHNPDSRVDKVRMKQSRRSGKVKVMILLEIDDMA